MRVSTSRSGFLQEIRIKGPNHQVVGEDNRKESAKRMGFALNEEYKLENKHTQAKITPYNPRS